MATTPNYSWVMPDPTDYVTDLPADFEIFGDAVDATVKSVSDAQIPKSIVDAKGDLIAATAADTVARLPVGTNGQVLVADSTAATGLNWAAQATGAPPALTTALAGQYVRVWTGYDSAGNKDYARAASGNQDRTDYTPVYLPTCTLDRLGVYCDTTFTTAGNVRLGIYNNGADNRPGSLLLDAGTVNVNAANTAFEVTISQAVTAGWYWLAANGQSGTFDLSVTRSALVNPLFNFTGSIGNSGLSAMNGYRQTSVTGAFPNPAGTLATVTQPIITWARIA